MAKSRQVMLATVGSAVLLVMGAVPAAAADDIILTTGEFLQGDLQEPTFTLRTSHGAYRITRANARQLVLGTATGDSVDLRNGNRLSGVLDQARYTVKLRGGRTRAFDRREIGAVVLGAPESDGTPVSNDVLVLANGNYVYGDLDGKEFDLLLPSGPQRFSRDALWRILLATAVGDTVELANGTQLSGVVNRPRYAIRTPDGQVLTYGRDEVGEVMFRLPAVARAAPGGTPGESGVASVSSPGRPPVGPSVGALAPATLPAPIRAVLRDLYFEFDRWDLTPEARHTLEDLAVAMKDFPALSLLVEGHADERGTSEYNLALGARRAQTAKDYLVSLGIEAGRVDTISYGEERPLDSTQTEMAWALNRRAHFVLRSR